jgi:hypothetical protein
LLPAAAQAFCDELSPQSADAASVRSSAAATGVRSVGALMLVARASAAAALNAHAFDAGTYSHAAASLLRCADAAPQAHSTRSSARTNDGADEGIIVTNRVFFVLFFMCVLCWME